jgi:hypothetical protein
MTQLEALLAAAGAGSACLLSPIGNVPGGTYFASVLRIGRH